MNLIAPATVYVLCLVTCVICAALLVRAYLRTRSSLLLGTAIGFGFLCLNNFFLVADLVIFPDSVDLMILRQASALAAIGALLYTFSGEMR